MAEAISTSQWVALLRRAWDTDQVVAGNVAIIGLIDRLSALALKLRADLSPDEYEARGLGTWDDDMAGLRARVDQYVLAMENAADLADRPARLLYVHAMVGEPIVNGRFSQAFFIGLPKIGTRGIRIDEYGNGRSFGDAFASASLLNQIVTAWAFDRSHHVSDLGGWVSGVITQTARQLEESAPGEDATAADSFARAARVVSDGAAAVLDTVKAGLGVLGLVAIGVGTVAVIGLIAYLKGKK